MYGWGRDLPTGGRKRRYLPVRRALNSPSNTQLRPSGFSDSPVHRNESGVISVNIHRVGVPSGRVPTCTMPSPDRRPI